MLELSCEEVELLKEKFPFLRPRNVFDDKLIKSDWYVGQSLPEGWTRLFLLYCRDICSKMTCSQVKKFRLSDVKEKYGTLRIYHMGATEDVNNITHMYENYSKNICCRCGNYSKYVTQGWIYYLCENCFSDIPTKYHIKHKKLKTLKLITYEHNKKKITRLSLKNIDKLYKKTLKMSDEEFLEFLLYSY